MRRTPSIPLLVLALATGVSCAPAREAAEPPPRHVLFITVDTLRADHLGCYGYGRDTSPNLDRLAGGGVLFEQAFAQWPKTGSSFASMFIGRYPSSTGLTHRAAQRIPEAYFTLPSYFERRGFTTVAVMSNAILNRDLGWQRGFDEYLETWHPGGEGGPVTDQPAVLRKAMSAPRVNELALPLLSRHRDTAHLFAWIHYSDPHGPYLLPAGVENPFIGDALYDESAAVPAKVRSPYLIDGRRDLAFYEAQYDANIRVADAAIGELLAHARGLGLLDDTLIIVTSDHGESLGEHGYFFGHGRLPYNNASRVPLIAVSTSRIAARRVTRPVELLDLYPTLLETFGGEAPAQMLEGQSLWPLLRGDTTGGWNHAFTEAGVPPTSHFRSVQDASGWKLVTVLKKRRSTRVQLFQLAEDPREERDVATEHPEEVRRLRRALQVWAAERALAERPAAPQEHSEETESALRALGYVE